MTFYVRGSTAKNSSVQGGGSAKRAVPTMGSSKQDDVFKNPPKGAGAPTMGRSSPGSQTKPLKRSRKSHVA